MALTDALKERAIAMLMLDLKRADVADKLRELRRAISQECGVSTAKKIVKSITDVIRGSYVALFGMTAKQWREKGETREGRKI